VPLFRGFHDTAKRAYPAVAARLAVYDALRRMLNAFVSDLLAELRRRVAALGATTLEEIRRAPERLAAFSAETEAARAEAKRFLYDNFYNSPGMEEVHEHGDRVVTELFAALMQEPERMPEDHQAQIESQGLARTVTDYIAGMTDAFIQQMWSQLVHR
jgi:dGTPase